MVRLESLEEGAEVSTQQTPNPAETLRVRTYRTSDTSQQHRSKLVKGLETLCRDFRRYAMTAGGYRKFDLTVEDGGVYSQYTPDDGAKEALRKFRNWIGSGNGKKGWIHILRVNDRQSPAKGERVSFSAGEYSAGTYAAAIVNEANVLASLGNRNSPREILRTTYMHEVGHILGAAHKHGAQFTAGGNRVNSAMLFLYGTPLHINHPASPEEVYEINNVMNRFAHRCSSEKKKPQKVWKVETKFCGCALSQFPTVVDDYNYPPTARITGPTEPPRPDKPLTFDGSESSDPDGKIQQYDWTLPSNATVLMRSDSGVEVKFSEPGDYEVMLTVSDRFGASDIKSKTVSVEENTPPNAQIAGPSGTIYTDTSYTFDGSASTDTDGTITKYVWSVTRGNAEFDSGTGKILTTSFNETGSYDITLSVTDNTGRSDEVTKTVGVKESPIENKPPKPKIDIPSGRLYTRAEYTFDGGRSSDPDGTIKSYRWTVTYGGNSVSTGSGETHSLSFSDSGTHHIELTVTDDDGVSRTESTSVEVREIPVH